MFLSPIAPQAARFAFSRRNLAIRRARAALAYKACQFFVVSFQKEGRSVSTPHAPRAGVGRMACPSPKEPLNLFSDFGRFSPKCQSFHLCILPVF
jgi:hypothetical protein